MVHRLPEKGQLEFEVLLATTNPDVREVIERIQLVSERVLFHWRTYPITLPPSIVDNRSICLKDLFILPTFDELDALTTDCKGNPKFLNHNQLESVKRKGQFIVPSVNFPSQNHVWKLNPVFQKGIETAREEYLDGLSFALRFLAVYAPHLIIGEDLSLRSALRHLKTDLMELFDLIIGYGRVYVPNLERRIQEERCKFLVAELKCKGDGAKDIGRYIRHQSSKAMRERVTMAMERPPPIPYRFTTPVSLDVDLRLFDKDTFRKICQPLTRILEKSSRGWFLSFREKVIAELRSRKLTENAIEMEANVMVMDEYLKLVYNAVRSNPEIQAAGPDIDRLLIEQAHLYVLMHRAVDEVGIKLEAYLRAQKKYLVGGYPVRSRDPVWMKIHMGNAKAHFCEDNKWLPHEIGLELCKQHFLKQHTYFLGRDLAFMRDTESVLRKELEADKVPCKTYEWKTMIWRPQNYVISRTLHGQTEVIPTVVSQVSTSITSPRTDPYQPAYSIKRMNTHTSTSRWPLWRFSNMVYRNIAWMLNVMYFLGYVVPWTSPISFRALFSARPFLPDLELSQVNGSLCPKKSAQTLSLLSRLTSIWRQVSKARTRFESQPDMGFLGKGWGRFLNRFWNYFVKGFLPSAALVLLFPIVSVTVCLLSVFLAVTTPLWMPAIILVFHLVCIFVYDFDCPIPARSKFCSIFVILGSLVVQGLAQAVLCILGAVLICPIVSALIVLWSLVNYGVRLGWDTLMFYALIKPKGRLPAGNSWLIKRIMGPGLAPEFYFEISIEQALIAFQTRLEAEELNIFYQKTNKAISQPQLEFKNFFTACFTPFSGKLCESEGPYKDLIRETHVLRTHLEDRVDKRRQALETGLNVATRSRVRMRKPALEKTLLAARKMAQEFYPEKLFSRMASLEEVQNYWEARSLEVSDWMNLTILLMSEIFCSDFLTPLEDSDVCFTLETTMKGSPVPVEHYLESIEDEFWSGEVPVTMSKVKYQIHSPFLDISAFNPMTHRSQHLAEDSISKYVSIPLPILHPAYISVIIHNRETEHQFQMDHPICQAILKALQDSGPTLNQDCISLDLDTSLSSSDELEEDTEIRSTPAYDTENVLCLDTPSPVICIGMPEDSRPAGTPSASGDAQSSQSTPTIPIKIPSTGSGTASQRDTPSLPIPIGRGGGVPQAGHSSKASLASPEEEMSLDESVFAKLGTSV